MALKSLQSFIEFAKKYAIGYDYKYTEIKGIGHVEKVAVSAEPKYCKTIEEIESEYIEHVKLVTRKLIPKNDLAIINFYFPTKITNYF